jgi:DNA primase
MGAGGGVKYSGRPLITREQAQAVKASVDLVEVAQRYVSLRKVGKLWVGRCPLHEGREVSNKSLTVDPERQNWKCWSCGKWGDAISMVMAFEGVAFPLAVRFLASQAGLEDKLPAWPAPPT